MENKITITETEDEVRIQGQFSIAATDKTDPNAIIGVASEDLKKGQLIELDLETGLIKGTK